QVPVEQMYMVSLKRTNSILMGSGLVASWLVAIAPFPAAVAQVPSIHSESAELIETYRLGTGDRIHIDVFNVPEYTGEKQVLVDGSINMPLVGDISLRGLTLDQAGGAIAQAYQALLHDPLVNVSLLEPRPLQVSIAGEVNRPGAYSIPLDERRAEGELQWPTVTQAIQMAGGITPTADVRQVYVQRSESGQRLNLDLWALLDGDLQQDIALRDGDTIYIPTAQSVNPAEATELATASFSPEVIRVHVVGEVMTPGVVEVVPNAPLNQALLAAGGFNNRRASKGSVDLIRLNPDGSVTQREVAVDLAQGINEETNPILYTGDVIVVGRSGTATFSDAVDGVFETLGRIFPLFRLF
ncbi:MAG: SLBB domain-containing protein, partial [Synechococcales bacterium]|nr:SLBB domain-containing protein [Synechococcales bacterium]